MSEPEYQSPSMRCPYWRSGVQCRFSPRHGGEHEFLDREGELRTALSAAQERIAGLLLREPTREEMEACLGDRNEVPQGDPHPAGWPTIRRCRVCGKAVPGGPTVCNGCAGAEAGRSETLLDAAYVAARDQERIEALESLLVKCGRKLGYLLRDYPGDKETAGILAEIRRIGGK